VEEQKSSLTEPSLTVGDGVVGMLNAFIDPKATAKRVPAPFSWLWPVIILFIVYFAVGLLTAPYAISIADAQIAQRGLPAEQAENARRITHVVTQITPIATPLVIMLFMTLSAWLVAVTGSIAGLRAKFRNVFSLMAACSLIVALQSIAVIIVVRAKGDEITSQEQLTPPFGLDLFFPNVHGALLAILNYFSIFQIWYLIVLTFGLAYLAKSSKGKAFFAITPAWLVPLFLRIVQAMFQPNTSG
jgi:hypothetical protein